MVKGLHYISCVMMSYQKVSVQGARYSDLCCSKDGACCMESSLWGEGILLPQYPSERKPQLGLGGKTHSDLNNTRRSGFRGILMDRLQMVRGRS